MTDPFPKNGTRLSIYGRNIAALIVVALQIELALMDGKATPTTKAVTEGNRPVECSQTLFPFRSRQLSKPAAAK